MNPFLESRKPRSPPKKKPRRGAGLLKPSSGCYLGGVLEDESLEVLDFLLLCFLWWLFLALLVSLLVSDEDDAAGVEDDEDDVFCASTGPAIRARARTGMSFLNILSGLQRFND